MLALVVAIVLLGEQSPTDFASYGMGGLIIAAFIAGWIVPKPQHDALRRDLDKREAQLETLIQTYQTEIIPVLTEVNLKILSFAAGNGSGDEPPRARRRP